MADEKIILGVDVDATEAIQSLSTLRAQMDALKDSQKKLDTTTEEGRKEFERLGAEIKNLNGQYNERQRALQNEIKASQRAGDSMKAMSAQLSTLKDKYKSMSAEERQSPIGKETLSQIKTLNDQLSAAEQEMGVYSRNVGNYEGALAKFFPRLSQGVELFKKFSGSTDAATTSMGNLGNSTPSIGTKLKTAFGNAGNAVKAFSKTLLTSPIGWIIALIGALVAIVQKVIDRFKQSDSAMTALSKAFAVFQPILGAINKLFDALVGWLAKGLEGFVKLANFISKGLGFEGLTKEATDLVQAMDSLQDAQNKLILKNAQVARELENLKAIYSDVTKSEKERTEAAEKYLSLYKSNTLENITQKFQALGNEVKLYNQETGGGTTQTQKLAKALDILAKSPEKLSESLETDILDNYILSVDKGLKGIAEDGDELKNKWTADFTAIVQLQTDFAEGTKRAQQTINKIHKEASDARDKQRATEAEAAKKYNEQIVKTYSSTMNAVRELLSNAQDIELHNLKAKQDQLEADLKTLLDNNKVTQEEYNSYMLVLASKYSDSVKAINDKYRDEEKQAKIKAAEDEYNLSVLSAKNRGEDTRAITEDYNAAMLEMLKEMYGEDSLQYQTFLDKKKTADDEYYKDKKQAEQEALNATVEAHNKAIESMKNIAATSLEAVSGFFDAQAAIENNDLKRFEAQQEDRKAILENRLKQGLISQTQYEAQIEQLQEQSDKKTAEIQYKQAKRSKALSIAQATISFASAIVSAIEGANKSGAATGAAAIATIPIFQSILNALTVASAGAALATAIATPLPKAAKGGIAGGGILQGASHAQGGIHIEAEGGEAIINKKSTARYAGLLSAINEAGGGVSFAHVGNGIFSKGGLVNNGGYGLRADGAVESMRNLKIYTAITDIRRGDAKYTQIVANKTL